jgi:DNA-binding LacI/PurR family transcriptional regulator
VILSDLHNPYFADVADGIEAAAGARGYRALISSGFLDAERERTAIETMLDLRVDGLIMLGSRIKVKKIEKMALTLPVVLVGRHTRSKLLDSVGGDDSDGAKQAVDHLVKLGHRVITHIHAGIAAGAPRRRRGYERAMKRHGLEEYLRTVRGDFTESGGAKAMQDILNGGDIPTAVVAPNDFAALGAMEVIDGAGLRIPDDISLVGYDDLALAGLPRIGLTTIGQPRTEFGSRAVHLLLERLDDGRTQARHLVEAPSLIVRSTTGPPRGGPIKATAHHIGATS